MKKTKLKGERNHKQVYLLPFPFDELVARVIYPCTPAGCPGPLLP